MSDALTLSALPSELQLCILQNLSTRRLLCHITRLSKYWFSLVCELVRQRTVRLLGRPGVGIIVSHQMHVSFPASTLITLISLLGDSSSKQLNPPILTPLPSH